MTFLFVPLKALVEAVPGTEEAVLELDLRPLGPVTRAVTDELEREAEEEGSYDDWNFGGFRLEAVRVVIGTNVVSRCSMLETGECFAW
jgi:hypothetical protein